MTAVPEVPENGIKTAKKFRKRSCKKVGYII